jgi:uncharacterized short protein YbdD (DUF466 family)
MRAAIAGIRRTGRHIWRGVREWCGDSAYERYVRACVARGECTLSAREFYIQQLDRRYSKPSRCC